MPNSERETCCANCHLMTPKSSLQCVHCEKPWNIALPVSIVASASYRKPTPDDIVAYNLWMQKQVLQ